MFVFANQPQVFSDLWGDAFRLFRQVFKSCIGLAMIFSLLVWLINYLFDFAHYSTFSMFLGGLLPGLFLWSFFALILQRVYATAMNKKTTLQDALSVIQSKLFFLLIATLVYLILIPLLFALIIVPGLIAAIFLLFYIPCILFDDKGIMSSLVESCRLVYRHWWQTFFLMCSFGFVALLGVACSILVVPFSPFLAFLLHVFLMGLSVLFFSALLIVQFNNLKLGRTIRLAAEELPSS